MVIIARKGVILIDEKDVRIVVPAYVIYENELTNAEIDVESIEREGTIILIENKSAGMAELADATDLKSVDGICRAGS